MAKIRMEVELDYDADMMYGDESDSKEWFLGLLRNNELVLHENTEVGDDLGTLRVLRILD